MPPRMRSAVAAAEKSSGISIDSRYSLRHRLLVDRVVQAEDPFLDATEGCTQQLGLEPQPVSAGGDLELLRLPGRRFPYFACDLGLLGLAIVEDQAFQSPGELGSGLGCVDGHHLASVAAVSLLHRLSIGELEHGLCEPAPPVAGRYAVRRDPARGSDEALRHNPGGRRPVTGGGSGGAPGPPRELGLRQDHDAQNDQSSDRAHERSGLDRRPGCEQSGAAPAAPTDRLLLSVRSGCSRTSP